MNEKHKLSWVNHGTKLKLSTTIDQRMIVIKRQYVSYCILDTNACYGVKWTH